MKNLTKPAIFFSNLAIISTLLFNNALVHAASVETVWGNAEQTPLLQTFQLTQPQTPTIKGLQLPAITQGISGKSTGNSLVFSSGVIDERKVSHVRYDQSYQGIPVFGYQVIYHIDPKKKTMVTGTLVNEINYDIKSIVPKLKSEEAIQIATKASAPAVAESSKPHQLVNNLVIYFDSEKQKAFLAYHVSFFQSTANGPTQPNYIIDANTGEQLKYWDGLPKVELGQGPGGVMFNNLPYRSGSYQFGTFYGPNTNSLGRFDIQINPNNTCSINNNLYRVISLQNLTEQQLPFRFPATVNNEITFNLQPFTYSCAAPNYVNQNDNGFAPVNFGFSPVNDAAYFMQESFKMFNSLGFAQPVGDHLPILVFVHVANLENAYAISGSGNVPGKTENNPATANQQAANNFRNQLVLGNGMDRLAPYTNGETIAHELMHLVVGNSSKLIYAEQSGGINESVSDAAGVTLKYYLQQRGAPWYWLGTDWALDLDVSKVNQAGRFMDNPPLDGASIGNAADFTPGMAVHNSSGVFNKAFVLMSNAFGGRLDMAFQLLLDANANCWTPNTDYEYGACCVIHAAQARGYNHQQVMAVARAFDQVGVRYTSVCRNH